MEWENKETEKKQEIEYRKLMEKESKFVGASVLEPGLFISLNLSKFVWEKQLREEIN